VLTIRDPSSVGAMAIGVSYDAFVDDVEVRGPCRLMTRRGRTVGVQRATTASMQPLRT